MSKSLFIALSIIAFAIAGIFAASEPAQIDSVRYTRLVAEIGEPQPPVVRGRNIIFTASGDARHMAIAFEHEGYAVLHNFMRLLPRGERGATQDPSGARTTQRAESTLFYIMEVPEETSEIRYRIVRDGLWSADPLNPQSVYDFSTGTRVSVVQVEPWRIYRTSSVDSRSVRFVYEGQSGEVIRLAGTFNNWDPFMYEMREFERGKYELTLPLPKGTWYYAFFIGTTQLQDTSSSMKVYTKDGRVASVITVE